MMVSSGRESLMKLTVIQLNLAWDCTSSDMYILQVKQEDGCILLAP
jgi:hypothetical protein